MAETKIMGLMICALPILLLDVVIYIFSFAWLRKMFSPSRDVYSAAHGEETKTHGAPRRAATNPHKLIDTIYDGGNAKTVYEMTGAAVRDHGTNVALVSRKFLEFKRLKETDRFPTKIYDDSELEELTYEAFGEQIRNFGAGLRSLGMEPVPRLKSGEKYDDASGPFILVLFEDTCKQWTVCLHGCFTQSITVATCYSTLGDDAVLAAVNETGATTLLLNWKNAEKFAAMEKQMPTLKTIVASTYEMPEGARATVPKSGSRIKILSSDEVIELGAKEAAEYRPVPPKPEDVALIMYTSGSTGKPKGVLMKHSQIVSAVSGMASTVGINEGNEIYVSYLPLAHVLALQAENAMISSGAKVCYADPRQLQKALPMFGPTLLPGVPKVWELLQAGVVRTMSQAGAKTIFDVLFEWNSLLLSIGLDAPVTGQFFKLISKKALGANLRLALSGGGAFSPRLHNFCRVCFCKDFVQGYALTETCVGGCFQDKLDRRTGVVGPPVECVEVMLQSEPDILDGAGFPYLHTDTVDNKGEPIIGRGEICMRGPCISSGYYKMPEKTKEEYDEEGWFHTGDIGQFTSDGVIQIVDRKKNLIKLKGGEYVAVEAMEIAFSSSPFVAAICVIANSNLDGPLSIVQTENEHLKTWASENSVEYKSLEELAAKKETKSAVLKSMIETGKQAKLTALELRMKDCCLIAGTVWLPGSGLTATMKIDRRKICSMHSKELHEMLERNGGLTC